MLHPGPWPWSGSLLLQQAACRRLRPAPLYLHGYKPTTYATGHSTQQLEAGYLLATTTMHAAASHRTQLQQQGIAATHVQYGGFQCRPPAPTKACMRHSRHGETPTPRRSDPHLPLQWFCSAHHLQGHSASSCYWMTESKVRRYLVRLTRV